MADQLYNGERPHGALKNMTPADFARQATKTAESGITEDGKNKPDGAPECVSQAENSHSGWYQDGG